MQRLAMARSGAPSGIQEFRAVMAMRRFIGNNVLYGRAVMTHLLLPEISFQIEHQTQKVLVSLDALQHSSVRPSDRLSAPNSSSRVEVAPPRIGCWKNSSASDPNFICI